MNDLKERYIHAVTKNLPRANRKDIEMELSTLIDDMLEERCGENTPTEKDLRVVLTELGTPAEVYSKYNPDAGKTLIGENYFPQYKRLMSIVLAAIVGGLTVAHLVSALLGQVAPTDALLAFLESTFNSVLAAFAIVTLGFAVLEKKGIKIGLPDDTIENLPPVPKKKDVISRGDSIVGIVMTVLLVVLLLCFPQHICIGFDGAGTHAGCYSVFYVQKLLEGRIWLLLFGAAGIVRHVLRMMEGRYTKRLLIASAVLDGLSVLFACLFLLRPDLVSPMYIMALEAETATVGMPPALYAMLANADVTLLCILIAATLIDLATDAVRTLRQ